MDDQELQRLEQKIEDLLRYCGELQTERRGLQHRLEEMEQRFVEAEERLSGLTQEREEVRRRVSSLISKIDQIGQGNAPVDSGLDG